MMWGMDIEVAKYVALIGVIIAFLIVEKLEPNTSINGLSMGGWVILWILLLIGLILKDLGVF